MKDKRNTAFTNRCPNILTFDIEDWFHILDLPGDDAVAEWDHHESRVEKNTNRILELLSRYDTRATFFVLGWIAERYPSLVRKIHESGHEVASHGYNHQLITSLTRDEFRKDLLKSKEVLKEITGENPVSYRCPGFSITRENDWALEEISNCGFLYDASIFPGRHGHGGHPAFNSEIVKIHFQQNELIEFPASVSRIIGTQMCFSGGGYLRLLSLWLIKKKINAFNRAGNPVMVYLHPREFDPQGPRLDMPLKRKFKCYVNVKSAEKKLIHLLEKYRFIRLRDYLDNCGHIASVYDLDRVR